MSDLQLPQNEFLTLEESAAVDQAMLTARDRFSARVAIYSLRSLKQVAQTKGLSVAELEPQQISDWVEQDPSVQPAGGIDSDFKGFFIQLVLSSLKPLKQIALETGAPIENLTVSQVIGWFEKEAKLRIERGGDATFLK